MGGEEKIGVRNLRACAIVNAVVSTHFDLMPVDDLQNNISSCHDILSIMKQKMNFKYMFVI